MHGSLNKRTGGRAGSPSPPADGSKNRPYLQSSSMDSRNSAAFFRTAAFSAGDMFAA
jgi:hypothetical protein